jgi:adenosylcobinamide-phosphate synthase
MIARDRDHLARALGSIALRPAPGEAPFVLVEVGLGVHAALPDRGYAVRRGDTFPGSTAAGCASRFATRRPATPSSAPSPRSGFAGVRRREVDPPAERGAVGNAAMSLDDVAVGLVLGYAADLAFGDPRRWHPVAGFGRVAQSLERHTYAPQRSSGVVHEAILVGGALALGQALARLPRVARVPVVAVATWAVLGGRSLAREAEAMDALLQADDLEGARVRIRSLVGRDPSGLDADELARACVESVAENGADAVVSPRSWGALGGVPGLLGYRAINTLDAMVGHRSARYAEFGWAAARLDDLANWVPARITVAVTALTTGTLTGARRVNAVVRRDAPAHPSPNAGPVEAAFAAALGRQLGRANDYDGVREERGRLGDGPPASTEEIARATALQQRIGAASLVGLVSARLLLRAVAHRRRRRTSR